jgi:hypothetical protein
MSVVKFEPHWDDVSDIEDSTEDWEVEWYNAEEFQQKC